MTKIIGAVFPYCVSIRKKLGSPDLIAGDCFFGTTVCGVGEYGLDNYGQFSDKFGIYQMRKCKEGKIPIRMKFYRPSEPATPAQVANWTKMSVAVSAWQSLTTEQKNAYNIEAKPYMLSGYNYFLRKYLLSL